MLHRPWSSQRRRRQPLDPALRSHPHGRPSENQDLLDQVGREEDIPVGRRSRSNRSPGHLQREGLLRATHEAYRQPALHKHLDLQD